MIKVYTSPRNDGNAYFCVIENVIPICSHFFALGKATASATTFQCLFDKSGDGNNPSAWMESKEFTISSGDLQVKREPEG